MSKSNAGVPQGKTYFSYEILFPSSHCCSCEHLGEAASGPNQMLLICI